MIACTAAAAAALLVLLISLDCRACMGRRPGSPQHHMPAVPAAEETPVHSKLLLHYARRLCTKTGTLPPPDLQQLVTTEAVVLVSGSVGSTVRGCWFEDSAGLR